VEFEPTIATFERAKTVHALDAEATVIGTQCSTLSESKHKINLKNVIHSSMFAVDLLAIDYHEFSLKNCQCCPLAHLLRSDVCDYVTSSLRILPLYWQHLAKFRHLPPFCCFFRALVSP
jgi:hypothetical protein